MGEDPGPPRAPPRPAGGPAATEGETPARKLTPLWKLLRGLGAYRAAWKAHAEPPAYEEAAFLVRVQSEADLAARDPWRIDAWENPFARDGPASPFVAGEPMLEAEGSPGAVPLVPFLAAAGARIDGLRLLDGTLIVKIERAGRAVQVRVMANDGPLLAGGGIRVCCDPGDDLPMAMARLAALWSVMGGPAPRPGWVRWARNGSC